ncbi:MAG: DUF3185 domain-containing protein [Candidatus Binatia bacterium]
MRIKPTVLFGIFLIIIGVVVFAYQGVTYTTRENVVDLGPIQADAETKKTIALPPILGAMVLASGIVLVVAGSKSSWMG